jgi:hypothetical protein
MPMPSRSVRSAGNRHSCGDTPQMSPAGFFVLKVGVRAEQAIAVAGLVIARRSRPGWLGNRTRPIGLHYVRSARLRRRGWF